MVDFVLVGVLVLALPLMSALFIGRSRYRLALVRTVNPQLVAAGQPASVSLSLANEGRAPSGVLLLEDHLPYVLGTRPRFVLEGIGHGWHRDVTYQIRSDVRGRFEIGPVTVRVKDVARLGEVLDAIVAAGANEINGITFVRDDSSATEDEARRAAVADARHKAEILAEAADLTLGPVLVLRDTPMMEGPRPMMMEARAAADSAWSSARERATARRSGCAKPAPRPRQPAKRRAPSWRP